MLPAPASPTEVRPLVADAGGVERELARDEDLVLSMYHAMGDAVDRYASSDCRLLGGVLKDAVQSRTPEVARVVSAHRGGNEHAERFQREHASELETLRSKLQTGLMRCGTESRVRDAMRLLADLGVGRASEAEASGNIAFDPHRATEGARHE
jgi:hypothetical protein